MRLQLAHSRMILLTVSIAAYSTATAAHWPQWRGPQADGVVSGGNPPIQWSESSNIRWKVAIPGEGHATPAIWGDKIFLLTAVPTGAGSAAAATDAAPPPPRRDDASPGATGQRPPRGGNNRGPGGRGGFGRGSAPTEEYAFTVICLDRETGAKLWEKVSRKEVPHEGRQQSNTHASSSPVTDGEHLIATFGSRGLYCYTLDGDLAWEKDLGNMQTRNSFGEGSSPALHNGILVVLWDTEADSYVYAFDKATGRELWKQSRDERTGWTTPFIKQHDGVTQVIVNGTTAVRSYELQTGKLLWECAGQTANAVPTIVAGPEVVYALSGYRGSAALAIQLGRTGVLTDTDAVLWSLNRGTPYVPSPLLYDGLLFFCQRNDAILSCVDATTGEVHFSQERIDGVSGIYASPIGVADRVYVAGQNGATAVVAKSTEFEVLAVNQLDEPIDASPVVVGDTLFLRGHRHLYCIAE